jgi:putrescine transport system permease protein
MDARWYWRALALPGVGWLILFVLVPTYVLVAVATGQVDQLFRPIPAWNPADWNVGFLSQAFGGAVPGGEYWPTVRNTVVYVACALALCILIGYPVAYYIARRARRTKTLLVVLLVLPFWVSYLMRMLAWVGLLSSDGYVNQTLTALGLRHPPDWLGGHPASVIAALAYGYIPFFILPVFAGLDRIDGRLLDAARNLGATPAQVFRTVTLPLSRPSLLAGGALVVLPMFGDYYTNDLISRSPRTSMLGNQINLYLQGGPQKNLGAALVIVMMAVLLTAMAYYVYATARDARMST